MQAPNVIVSMIQAMEKIHHTVSAFKEEKKRVIDQCVTFDYMIVFNVKTQIVAEAYVDILLAAMAGRCLRVAREGVFGYLAIAEIACRLDCRVGLCCEPQAKKKKDSCVRG